MEISDQQIIELIKSTSTKEKGFSLLLDKYQERLYWNIRRIVVAHEDANDVLQNTSIKIWKGLDKFRADSSLFTWLYRISVNESLQHIKQNKKHSFFVPESTKEVLIEKLEADEYFDGDDVERKLQKAILELPKKQRLVFNMKYYEDLKYEEISEILGTSVGSLKASYHIASKKIENYVKQLQ